MQVKRITLTILSDILVWVRRLVPYLAKYSDRQAWANSVDPDQMLHYAASDQGLHCLLMIKQQWAASTGISEIFE